MRETQSPSGTLHITDNGTDLHFFVQVENQNLNEDKILLEYHMDLYVAKLHKTSSPAQLLHSQPLPLTWTWHRISSIGDIDYKHGVLCWSATDRILCSKWKPGYEVLTDIHQVLKPGMAAQVCNGEYDINNYYIYCIVDVRSYLICLYLMSLLVSDCHVML